jgi:hypothetical protein
VGLGGSLFEGHTCLGLAAVGPYRTTGLGGRAGSGTYVDRVHNTRQINAENGSRSFESMWYIEHTTCL